MVHRQVLRSTCQQHYHHRHGMQSHRQPQHRSVRHRPQRSLPSPLRPHPSTAASTSSSHQTSGCSSSSSVSSMLATDRHCIAVTGCCNTSQHTHTYSQQTSTTVPPPVTLLTHYFKHSLLIYEILPLLSSFTVTVTQMSQ